MSFRVKLSELRQQHHFSQLDLAQKLDISDRTISLWERGLSIPNIHMLSKIASIFHVSTDYLLGNTTIPAPVADLFEDKNMIAIQREYAKMNEVQRKKLMQILEISMADYFPSEKSENTKLS